jgi:predicted glutamine amidotransferase
MCNLLGIYLPEGQKLDSELKRLLFSVQYYASTVHSDGWGMFSSKGEHTKSHLASYTSGWTKEILELDEDNSFVILHTRKTSSGKVEKPKTNDAEELKKFQELKQSFAHPFVYENLALAHNGTLVGKRHIDFEMDSRFFASSLSETLKVKDLATSLEETFDMFERGLYSMLFAVKEDSWTPYILKGNKPLHKYICNNTGVEIVVTDERFIDPFLMVLNSTSDYEFQGAPILKKGLYIPFQEEPLFEKEYVYNYTTKTHTLFQKALPTTKNKTVVREAKTPFNKWVKENGIPELISVTRYILTKMTYHQVMNILDFTEGQVVTLISLIHEEKFDEIEEML